MCVALVAAMPACAFANDWSVTQQQRLLVSDSAGSPTSTLLFVNQGPQAQEPPTLAAGMRFQLRYRVETTDRFDPANLRVFGGAIGGNGVKGGAVVSLSWPTEH
jgi:hypothetical protein